MPRERHVKEEKTIIERFAEYNEKNPEVYEMFKKYAVYLLGKGFKKGAARMIIERMRWEFLERIEKGGEEYSLPNDFTPYFARKLAEEDARFQDFFTFRATPMLDRARAAEERRARLEELGGGQ